MLRKEGEDPFISEELYRVVVQAVLLFGEETWVMLTVIAKKLEGTHVGFLWKVTGNKTRIQKDDY